MSFLANVSMDPHLHLHVLAKMGNSNTQQQFQRRVYYLSKTRRFPELLQAVSHLQNNKFPNLEQQLKAAQQKTNELKTDYNDDNLDDVIAKLDQASMSDEADNKEVDEGQLKVYKLAKLYYEEGNFQKAYDIILKLEKQGLNDELYIKTTWARVYCEILLNIKTTKTFERLRKKIEETEEIEKEDLVQSDKETHQINFSKKVYARKQEYLNLAILVYFNDPTEEDLEKFADLCTSKEYFSVAQLVCPHVLKYLCVAYILNKTLHKNRQYDLFMLLEVIRRKVIKYSDSFVEFLEDLNIHYDFSQAREKIGELKASAEADPLLFNLTDQIIQNCYFLFYKVYCRVYEQVSLEKIAEFTGKSVEEAEMWVLGFIRSLDIEAKIDSVEGVVVAFREEESLNEKYIELLPKARGFINNLQSTSR